MANDDVLMICFGEGLSLAQALSAQVNEGDAPPIETKIIDAADAVANLAAEPWALVWLVVDGPVDDVYFDLLDRLGSGQTPTLITRVGEKQAAGTIFQPGCVIVPADTDTAAISLLVRGMLSQADGMFHLRQQLNITQRHHGGLRGQMDKLDEELRLAAKVQQESLPARMPRVGEIDVNVMFRPAGYVSGDVYDVQRLDENHIGLWIADVVGHGVPAALMTMFLKAALPTKEVDGDGYRIVSPEKALSQLNDDMISRSIGSTRFATAVYIVINCRTLEARVARAGHPLPMLLRDNGVIEELDPDGPLLGVFEDETFEVKTVQLQPGDRLVMFSDGFETAFAEGDKHNIERYKREFEMLREGSCAQALERLEHLVHSQPGSLHQIDDLTVIMVGVGNAATCIEPDTQTVVAR